MQPIDTVQQELQHRDNRHSRLPIAIEKRAPSAIQKSLPIENHLQMQIENAPCAHKCRSGYHLNKKPARFQTKRAFFIATVLMNETSNRDELVHMTKNRCF